MGVCVEMINIIQSLYDSTKISILLNKQIGLPFPTILGVEHVFLLSPVLFNIFLEIIMQDTLANT